MCFIPLIAAGWCSSKNIGTARISPTQGRFALFNRLVIGNAKFKGVQRVYCNQFPAKPFYGSHQLDLVMIRSLGINNGAFVVLPDSVWYASVLLLFSTCAMTDTGSKSFKCALISTLETYDDPDNGNYEYYIYYIHYYNYYNCDTYTIWLLWQIYVLLQLCSLLLVLFCSLVGISCL